MESSFLEDFLKREVDQSQVNALVGSFENQLTTPRSNPLPTKSISSTTSSQITSLSQLVSQSTVKSNQNLVINRNGLPASSRTLLNGNVKHIISTSSNLPVAYTSTVTNPLKSSSPRPALSGSPHVGIRAVTPDRQVSNSPRPLTPVRHVIGVSTAIANNVSPQISIAPKLTNTVPIAPRPGANIMITPRQAQLLMAQRFGPNAALIPNNLLARMPGGIPVMPRMGAGTIAAVPPIMHTQIPGLRGLARGPGILSMSQKNDPMRMNTPLVATSLTQVKPPGCIPGQINYRFRQVNPASAGVSQVTNGAAAAAAANSAANITLMKESVKRLKEFFQNLINLACGPNQQPEIGKMVKELVHNLMQGRVSEEEFIEKLQKTLKSDPQPNLVHFLKKTLPHLRETIKKQQMQQNVKGSTIQANSVIRNQVRPANLQAVGVPRGTLPISGPRHAIPQPLLANKQLTPQEHMMLQKQLSQQGRVVVATSGQVTPGMKTFMPGAAHIAAGNFAGKIPGLMGNANKEKPKNTYYSSAVGGDDDINDVTCMAGVNLMEESQKILATGADFMSHQTRSVKDTPLLVIEKLKSKVDEIAKKHTLTDIGPEVLTIISHGAEEKLRNLLERLTACSLHRNDPHKDEVRYETISDVRNQLRVFEEIDEVERKHRDSREREMLLRVAKSRSRTEDPEQARLKEKAKQMQLEEEEISRKRAANRTALEAIGGPRKKRKLDEALESLQNAPTPGGGNGNSSTPSSSTHTAQTTRSRQHRITLKDLTFVLESDKETSKSLTLYRSYVNR